MIEKNCFMPRSANKKRQGWRLEDIDFHAIQPDLVRSDELLFTMLASASFVEILSELYSSNLIAHCRGNAEAVVWLEKDWQREEVQHGRALKAYVQAVWPEFDWDCAYAGFRTEYGALCTSEQLESSPALEMVARCVVETGTSTLYRALYDYVREPVLRQLFANIKADEANHYTHFRRHFETCNRVDRHGACAVTGAILRRLREIRGEDSYIAFKHVYCGRNPGIPFRETEWRRYSRLVKRHARRYYPYAMAVKMLIKPIPLYEPLKRILHWPLVGVARLVCLG